MAHSTRWRWEALIAVLFALGMAAVGGGTLWYLSVMPVHGDPADIPSDVAVANADRHAKAIEASRQLVRAQLVQDNLPSLSVAVAADGDVVWTEAIGWANLDRREAITPAMRFPLASVSKTLTAAALLRLHEREVLDLDAPVQTYVKDYFQPVTSRQLMNDVGGVHRIRGDNNDQVPRECQSLDQAVASFAGEPLLFEPGTRHRFSNNGWILLSAVVEGAARKPFGMAIADIVFEPLGLTNTVLSDTAVPDVIDSLAIDLGTKLGLDPEVREPSDSSCLFGAGALVSTPSDLARFGAAMLRPGFLRTDSIALFQTPPPLTSGQSSSFAFGWRVEPVSLAGKSVKMLAHRATPWGYTIALLMFPEQGLVVAVASNTQGAGAIEPLGIRIAETFAQ